MAEITVVLKALVLPTVVFEGKVFSGKGEGKKFVSLPWVKQQMIVKAGFEPYPGTLNLHLNTKNIAKKQLLGKARQMTITPKEGFCPGILIKAQIDDAQAAIVAPQVPGYPEDVLEVISPVFLREKMKLVDGSAVTVIVKV